VELIDSEQQLCSYVAISLGRSELLLTQHEGHVVAVIPTPTPISSILSIACAEMSSSPRIICGGDNGYEYDNDDDEEEEEHDYEIVFLSAIDIQIMLPNYRICIIIRPPSKHYTYEYVVTSMVFTDIFFLHHTKGMICFR
jgi:hypothetical protein